jgi:hypothetical protein
MGPLGGFWPKLGRKRVTGWKQRSCVPPGRVKTNKQTIHRDSLLDIARGRRFHLMRRNRDDTTCSYQERGWGWVIIVKRSCPFPTFEHSTDCTCCYFGHLRFIRSQFYTQQGKIWLHHVLFSRKTSNFLSLYICI